MVSHVIVVDNRADWKDDLPDYPVVTARDYLSQPEFGERGMRVINLCRDYSYLATGYYVSLLAEARRHRVVPGVRTLSDLSRKSLYSLDAADLDEELAKQLKDTGDEKLECDIYFGRTRDARLQDVARQLFEIFPAPLLHAEIGRDHGNWRVTKIRPVSLNQLNVEQREFFRTALEAHLARPWRGRKSKGRTRYDMAILYNYDDPLPPSDKKALRLFEKVGKQLGIGIDIIGRKDYAKLAEYDALFIRDTTRIDHYTYRFAKKAESEGMVVIDDPNSILRCTNKVYLAELLRAHRIPHPKTVILQEGRLEGLLEELSFPIVLKIPDGSFSKGVHKAHNREELEAITRELFKDSDLILAQEYVYTEYDWRIGILNRRPLYACQYFMSKNHWQIVDHKSDGGFSEGGFRTMPVEAAPDRVVKTALRAANLIGDGLYGVDLKQNERGVYVIEVNDNPNLEAGVEDGYLKDELYRAILMEFISRLERKRHAS